MARDAAKALLDRVQAKVYRKQRNRLRKFVGTYVERNGVTYRVVALSRTGKNVVLSDVKTSPDHLFTMSAKAFLSRKITPAEIKQDGFVNGRNTDRGRR